MATFRPVIFHLDCILEPPGNFPNSSWVSPSWDSHVVGLGNKRAVGVLELLPWQPLVPSLGGGCCFGVQNHLLAAWGGHCYLVFAVFMVDVGSGSHINLKYAVLKQHVWHKPILGLDENDLFYGKIPMTLIPVRMLIIGRLPVKSISSQGKMGRTLRRCTQTGWREGR